MYPTLCADGRAVNMSQIKHLDGRYNPATTPHVVAGNAIWYNRHHPHPHFDPQARRQETRPRARRHARHRGGGKPTDRQRHGQSDRRGVPLGQNAGEQHARDHRGDRRGGENQLRFIVLLLRRTGAVCSLGDCAAL